MILFLLSLAGWINLGAIEGETPQYRVLNEGLGNMRIEFTIGGFYLGRIKIDGKDYSTIKIPNTVDYLEKGYPSLPRVAKSVMIPDDREMKIKVIEREIERIKVLPIVPSKGNLYRDIDPTLVPYTFSDFYSSKDMFPEEIVTLSEPFILRDFRGITLYYNPVRYDAGTGELEITKRIVVEIYSDGIGSLNVKEKPIHSISRDFRNIYNEFFINFRAGRYDTLDEHAGRMIIISADTYLSEMDSLVEWKRRKGITTDLYALSTIGNNETNIKDFIQSQYDTEGVTFCLLVGDGDELTPGTGTVGDASGKDADPVYSYTAGDDNYSDLFISRFSSDNHSTTKIKNQVMRSIKYERNPQGGEEWYRHGLGVASDQSGGTGIKDKERMDWLRDTLLSTIQPYFTYTSVDSSYAPWGTSTIIANAINEGRSIINYIGHGSTSGWSNGGGFHINDINNLTNSWKLPHVISVACQVGNFNGNDCYCEASVDAGMVDNPIGFLTNWGSTIDQSWVPPCIGQEGAINIFSHYKANTAGGIYFNGASYMIEQYGGSSSSDGVEMAQTWHIFGDASIQLRTDIPDTLDVTHPPIAPPGPFDFTVTVKDNDGVTPIEDALVCCYLREDSLLESAYTNSEGKVTLYLNPSSSFVGEDISVTVTAFNYKPYMDTAVVTVFDRPYPVYGHGVILAGSDTLISPGESVDLIAWVKNIGNQDAYGVYGILTSSDPYITGITVDSAYFGNIHAFDSLEGTPAYEFDVSIYTQDQHILSFDFVTHDKNDSTVISHPEYVVYAPNLSYVSDSIDDSSGNNDSIWDPGEQVNLILTVVNNGHLDASSVTALLQITDMYITIDSDSSNYGNIPQGAQTDNSLNPFIVTADASTPMGHRVEFDVIFTYNGGLVDTVSFDEEVGIGGVDWANHDIGNTILTVTRYGSIGFMTDNQSEGDGWKYPHAGSNGLFIGSFAAGTGIDWVADRYYSKPLGEKTDWETTISPDGKVRMGVSGYSDQNSGARFDDRGHPLSKGLLVEQMGWAWNNTGADDFVILKYIIHNTSALTINGVYFGIFMDMDIDAYDIGGVDENRPLVFMRSSGGGSYYGLRPLDDSLSSMNRVSLQYNPEDVYPWSGMPDSLMFRYMDGSKYRDTSTAGSEDYGFNASVGPYDIPPGDSVTAAFALVGGNSLSELQIHSDTAFSYYWLFAGIEEQKEEPEVYSMMMALNVAMHGFDLKYSLPDKARIDFKVYDATGRLIKHITDIKEAGFYEIGIDMSNRAAGVYFIRMEANKRKFTEKAVLIR